jgi:hypothetical protein
MKMRKNTGASAHRIFPRS